MRVIISHPSKCGPPRSSFWGKAMYKITVIPPHGDNNSIQNVDASGDSLTSYTEIYTTDLTDSFVDILEWLYFLSFLT